MARSATIAVAALAGLLFAGCAGGSFGQAGLSLPHAGDGVQTVADAADALDAHRTPASESAKAAIAVTDALGSFVRTVTADERIVGSASARFTGRSVRFTHFVRNKDVVSGSQLVLRPSYGNVAAYCTSSAGYSVRGIPSLDQTFGWQSGAISGGARETDNRGSATWSANASGIVVRGAIGGLTLSRGHSNMGCPISSMPYGLTGGDAKNAFSIPISMAFRHGSLSSLTVSDARFSNGENLDVRSDINGQRVSVAGYVRSGRTQLATFRTDGAGNGTLTITSTGAQYAIADWVVVGI
jgi:hypothetical protein